VGAFEALVQRNTSRRVTKILHTDISACSFELVFTKSIKQYTQIRFYADVSTGKARRDEEARVAAVVAAARAEVS